MTLKVDGGPARTLVCVGEIGEARCHWGDKKVDFGAVAVGTCVCVCTAIVLQFDCLCTFIRNFACLCGKCMCRIE